MTGAEPFRGDIISTTQYGLDVTFHQDNGTIIFYQCLLSSPPFEGGLRGVGPLATWPLLLPPRGAAASHPYLKPWGKSFKYMTVRKAKRGGYADVGARPLLDDQAGEDQLGTGQLKGCYSAYRFLNNVGLMKLQW